MTIGKKIKQKRLELNLSQDELAKKCGYKSRSSINKIELARDLPLNKIEVMAKALDVSPAYLMGWEKERSQAEKAVAAKAYDWMIVSSANKAEAIIPDDFVLEYMMASDSVKKQIKDYAEYIMKKDR